MPIDEDLVIHYDLSLSKVKSHINYFVTLPNRPDAISCVNDPTAIEAVRIIKESALRVPEDIAVVGFSNNYVSALIKPALTTVEQPIREMGRIAADRLFKQIDRSVDEWKAPTVILKTQLLVRNSS
jgi:DNA-binding LacI/PurR family transcriptional regulator